jgi:quinol monooxygenase YgiN
MIIRVFRATIHPGKEAEFESFLRHTAVPLVSRQTGLLTQHVGRSLKAPSTYLYVTIWERAESIQAFASANRCSLRSRLVRRFGAAAKAWSGWRRSVPGLALSGREAPGSVVPGGRYSRSQLSELPTAVACWMSPSAEAE